MGAAIFVETTVHADAGTLWHRTQDAAQHTRWDLRFTTIDDVTAQSPGAPRTFRYDLRLPGLTISGTGTSIGERRRPDGTLTSALAFGSPHPLSLVRRGKGWWRYVPDPAGGTRFLTGFDYDPGWGAPGRLVDRAGFRVLVGWGTAWSFDRLRLWLDDGVAPEDAARRWLLDTGLRVGALGLAARRGGPVGAVLAAAAVAAPALPGVPRARRCLRRPPDRLARTAPSTVADL